MEFNEEQKRMFSALRDRIYRGIDSFNTMLDDTHYNTALMILDEVRKDVEVLKYIVVQEVKLREKL